MFERSVSDRSSTTTRGMLDIAFAVLSATLLIFLVGPLLAVLLADPQAAFIGSWSDQELLLAVAVSFGCALAAVAVGSLLGVPLAYLLERRDFRGRRLVMATLALPLVIPHPVVGIALLLLFAKNRLLGAIIEGQLGIAVVSAVPGIILAMTFVSAPLIVLAAQEGFRGDGARLERVAQSLGASRLRAFGAVALPLARPAILAGVVSALARSVSEFGSIAVLAYFPRTAPVLIWDRFTTFGLSAALPATAFLLLVMLAIFWGWNLLDQRRPRA
jgi:molybdate/tungstate transport system permease protein